MKPSKVLWLVCVYLSFQDFLNHPGTVARIEGLCALAGLPRRLSEVGLRQERIGWLADNSGGASLRGNPLELDQGALVDILTQIW